MSAPVSAFVAVLCNREEIVLAHVKRQSPESAAHPFPQESHSLGRRCHVFRFRGEDSAHLNGRGARPGQTVIGCIFSRPAAAAQGRIPPAALRRGEPPITPAADRLGRFRDASIQDVGAIRSI
jgi:hypothetical protein